MGFLSAFLMGSALTSTPQKDTFGSTPTEVLRQAGAVAGKLTARTEKCVAYLTLAQAQNKLGDKNSALKSLDLGWQAYKKGSDKGLSEGDRFDIQFLFNEGDQATLPEPYAIEYLIAGNKPKAMEVAASFGDTPLGQAFRHSIGEKIRDRYPNDFYDLAYTDAERKRQVARKQTLIDNAAKVKDEPDLGKRAFLLWGVANDLITLNGKKEALEILKDAIALSPKIDPLAIRITFMSQVAATLWYAGAKDEAKSMMEETTKLDASLVGDPKEVLQTHFFVEQSRRTLGMPNNLEKVMQEQNKLAGVVIPPSQGIQKSSPPNSTDAYGMLSNAGVLVANSDKVGARKLLEKIGHIKVMENDKSGWWLVLAAEMQIRIGDKDAAKANLAAGSRLFLAMLRPVMGGPGEDLSQLERMSQLMVEAGDKLTASKTIQTGIEKFTAGPTTTKMLHMGDGGNHMVLHDRRSPTLHKGALILAGIGDFDGALAMARSIPNAAHRAIALAGIVRNNNVQPQGGSKL